MHSAVHHKTMPLPGVAQYNRVSPYQWPLPDAALASQKRSAILSLVKQRKERRNLFVIDLGRGDLQENPTRVIQEPPIIQH